MKPAGPSTRRKPQGARPKASRLTPGRGSAARPMRALWPLWRPLFQNCPPGTTPAPRG